MLNTMDRRMMAFASADGDGSLMASRAVADFGLPDLMDIIVRRGRLIAMVAGGLFVLGLAALALRAPTYVATAVVMINPGQDRVVADDQALSAVTPSPALVESEIQILSSPSLARRLVTQLNLMADREWNDALGGMSFFGAKADPEMVAERVAEKVLKAIKVQRRELSYVIDISVASKDPRRAAQMANTLVALYMQYGTEARTEVSERANQWLSERLVELRADVQKKEAAQEAYRAQYGLLGSSGSTLTEQQITSVQTSVLEARADLAEKQARLRALKDIESSGASADSIAGVLNSEVVRDLRTREADLARSQAELTKRYGALHPAIESNRVELAQIRNQIAGEIARQATNLQNEVRVASARLAAMDGRLGAVRNELSANNASLVRLNELEREAAGARAVYESFLKRQHQLTQQGAINNDTRLVSLAKAPPKPSGPSRTLLALIFLAVAGAIGVLVGIVVEAADDSFHDAAAVTRKTGLPVVASVPAIKKQVLNLLHPTRIDPARYFIDQPYSAFAEAIRVLHIAVLYSQGQEAPRVLAMTSAVPGEGKSTCALSLARLSALAGQKVLIVDCDLRRRTLNRMLNLTPEIGLLEVLSGANNWTEARTVDTQTGLHVLPIATWHLMPHDVFGSESMKTLLADLRSAYDLVVLDCPPVLAVAEVRTITRLSDATVIVARADKTSGPAVGAAIDQVEQTGGHVIGVALNNVSLDVPRRYTSSDSLCFRHVQEYYSGV